MNSRPNIRDDLVILLLSVQLVGQTYPTRNSDRQDVRVQKIQDGQALFATPQSCVRPDGNK